MPISNEQQRKRYAEDTEHRERKLAANRAYRAEHREKLNALRREKWRSNLELRERRRTRHRMAYGLSMEGYERMLMEQDGACAICKRKSYRRLCIDHCHATRRVRGLLCDKCNTSLGLLDDDSDRMREAGTYMDRARGAAEARAGRRPDILIRGAESERRHVPGIRAALYLRADVGGFRVG